MFFQQQEAKILDGIFSDFVYLRFCVLEPHCFFPFSWKFPIFKTRPKDFNSRGLQTKASQIFIIRIRMVVRFIRVRIFNYFQNVITCEVNC